MKVQGIFPIFWFAALFFLLVTSQVFLWFLGQQSFGDVPHCGFPVLLDQGLTPVLSFSHNWGFFSQVTDAFVFYGAFSFL